MYNKYLLNEFHSHNNDHMEGRCYIFSSYFVDGEVVSLGAESKVFYPISLCHWQDAEIKLELVSVNFPNTRVVNNKPFQKINPPTQKSLQYTVKQNFF